MPPFSVSRGCGGERSLETHRGRASLFQGAARRRRLRPGASGRSPPRGARRGQDHDSLKCYTRRSSAATRLPAPPTTGANTRRLPCKRDGRAGDLLPMVELQCAGTRLSARGAVDSILSGHGAAAGCPSPRAIPDPLPRPAVDAGLPAHTPSPRGTLYTWPGPATFSLPRTGGRAPSSRAAGPAKALHCRS